mmetsp:Transcript_9255/g.17666  ORF Transcript_9255/g.17666 Transcript_9255/m.17666 type:complete len:848 (-) Transcript_9255:1671-4214(-)
MEAAKSLFEKDPSAVKVDLSGLNIETLDGVLDVLEQFEDLQELVLSKNSLTELPDDLSSLRKLKSLDLSQNAFEGVEVLVTALTTISGLEELSVDLKVESDKDLLQLELPELKILNGEKLVFDFGESLLVTEHEDKAPHVEENHHEEQHVVAVEAHEEIKEQSHHAEAQSHSHDEVHVAESHVHTEVHSAETGGEVTVIHEEVKHETHQTSAVESHQAISEDKHEHSAESAKVETHVEAESHDLKPISEAKSLEPDTASHEHEDKQHSGDEKPHEEKHPHVVEEHQHHEEEKPHTELHVEHGHSGHVHADEAKGENAEDEAADIEALPAKSHDFSIVRQSPLDNSESSLVEAALTKAYLDDEAYGEFLGQVEALKDSYILSLEIGGSTGETLKTKFVLKLLALKHLVAKTPNSIIALKLIEGLAQHFEEATAHPKQESPTKSDHFSINTETAELVEDLERLERENFMLKQDKEALRSDFELEKHELHNEIESLQQENRKYLDTIIKHSKANADNTLSKSVQLADSPQRSIQSISYSKSVKALTLKQLRDVIEEIYTSKAKFDLRCIESRQPRETLEQHMYNFLNQKYGLKKLTLEWASAILAGVQKYSGEDNDVAVFGKVLKNQCDEEFRHVQQQVKDTIAELLKMHLRGKFPLKNNGEIAEMQAEKMNGFLAEEEWLDIVKYMYNETDSELLINLLKEVASRKTYPVDHQPRKQRLSREDIVARRERERAVKGRIAYKDFLKVLLDFQLKGHEQFLTPYLKLFRNVDSDSNGVISEYEFRNLIGSMGLNFVEDEVLRMLQLVDPFNNQLITFSESVTLFTSEMIAADEAETLVSVLQALSATAELS